jgi:hypothetical protein
MNRTPRQAWPELSTHVQILGPWNDYWLPSLVEDQTERILQLSVPNNPGSIVPIVAEEGDDLLLRWADNRGDAELECRITSVSRRALASWEVEALAPTIFSQRRDYVRVDVRMPLKVVTRIGSTNLEGWAIDISEGGVRLVTNDVLVTSGQLVVVEMVIGDETIAADAEVIRAQADGDGYAILALKFVELQRRDGDRIRRYVFDSQLRTPVRRS